MKHGHKEKKTSIKIVLSEKMNDKKKNNQTNIKQKETTSTF